MKLYKYFLLIFFLPAVIYAGGSRESSTENQLKFAALMPGPINDGGWNSLMYNSLKYQGEQFGAETAYTEQTPPSDYEEILRAYAQEGFKVVFGHGFEFGAPAFKTAKEFPNTFFIINSSNISLPDNLASFVIDDFQCGFAQGAIAAAVTKTGVVGYIGGMEIPPIVNQAAGFKAGVKFINPNVRAVCIFTGSFADSARAKETAISMISSGADVISCDANEANKGIYEGAKEHGVYVIGSSSDIYNTAPEMRDVILTSVTENMLKGHYRVVKDIMDGTFEAKNYVLGFESGAVQIAPLREMESELTAEQLGIIRKLSRDLNTGSINMDDWK